VLRGNILSPVLLNIVLEKALMSKTNIKQGIENEDFSAFSDGLLLVAKNKEHAE
jgi:hypothetical protein